MNRTIRKTALLQFEKVSFSRDFVKWVKDEGYTDIGSSLNPGDRAFTGQGYVWEQVCQFAEWGEEFGLGLVVFTGYMKYQEGLVAKEPRQACS